jgi:FMN phosphatase YigB (HAD superfamily)
MDGVEALIFDVFGTTVDWRSTVEQELKELGKKYSIGESFRNLLKLVNSFDLTFCRKP